MHFHIIYNRLWDSLPQTITEAKNSVKCKKMWTFIRITGISRVIILIASKKNIRSSLKLYVSGFKHFSVRDLSEEQITSLLPAVGLLLSLKHLVLAIVREDTGLDAPGV